jgi:hypothetical protein
MAVYLLMYPAGLVVMAAIVRGGPKERASHAEPDVVDHHNAGPVPE